MFRNGGSQYSKWCYLEFFATPQDGYKENGVCGESPRPLHGKMILHKTDDLRM